MRFSLTNERCINASQTHYLRWHFPERVLFLILCMLSGIIFPQIYLLLKIFCILENFDSSDKLQTEKTCSYTWWYVFKVESLHKTPATPGFLRNLINSCNELRKKNLVRYEYVYVLKHSINSLKPFKHCKSLPILMINFGTKP